MIDLTRRPAEACVHKSSCQHDTRALLKSSHGTSNVQRRGPISFLAVGTRQNARTRSQKQLSTQYKQFETQYWRTRPCSVTDYEIT